MAFVYYDFLTYGFIGGEMNAKTLEQRVKSLEENQESVSDLVDLLRDVRSALKVFVHVGNGLKWLVTLGASIAGVWYGLKHWLAP